MKTEKDRLQAKATRVNRKDDSSFLPKTDRATQIARDFKPRHKEPPLDVVKAPEPTIWTPHTYKGDELRQFTGRAGAADHKNIKSKG
jgi:hypothetical protein